MMKRKAIQLVATPRTDGDPDLYALCNDGTILGLNHGGQWVELPEIPQPIAEVRCAAKQYSDQMACKRCDIAWDVNDPHPPTCGQIAKG